MNKSEMEHHRAAYYQHLSDAMSALEQNACNEAVRSAVSSLDHLDGMMQYERKYEGKESFDIAAINLVLRFAPLMFDEESIDRLEALLKEQRRIAKYTNTNLEQRVAAARETMWHAHHLWNQLESHAHASEAGTAGERGENREQQRKVLEEWGQMGLVCQSEKPARVSLTTDMDQAIAARCPACGVVAKAPKTKALEQRHCPKCRASVSFVLLASESAGRR
jgi:hypothetical protein